MANAVTGKQLQRVRAKSIGDSTQSVVYRLPEQYVKSLESNPEETGLDYTVCRQFYQNIVAGDDKITLTSNHDNEKFIIDGNTSVSVAVNNSQPGDPSQIIGNFIAIEKFEIQNDGRRLIIYPTKPIQPGYTAKVLTSIYVVNAKSKRKIFRQDASIVVSYPDSGKNIISLGKADVLQVKSITLLHANPAQRIDLLNNYYFDNGCRENYYDLSSINLKRGFPPVTNNDLDQSQGYSGEIEIVFDYLEHSNEGDFFTVDSYTHEEGISYTEIPYYEREPSGATHHRNEDLPTCLRDCVDFRPIVNTTGINASRIAQIEPGLAAAEAVNFRDTTTNGNGFAPRMPVPNSQIRSDSEYYVGKIDSLFLTKEVLLF